MKPYLLILLIPSCTSFVAAPQRRGRAPTILQPHFLTRTFSASSCSTISRIPSLHLGAAVASSLDYDGGNGDSDNDDSSIKIEWWKPMMAICGPAWIGMMADPVLSLMDTAFVGRLGSVELAALGACTSIFHLAFNAFRATTAATTTLVATADTIEEKKKVIQVSLRLGFVLGWVVLLTLQLTGPWCLARMGISNTSALYPPALQYLTTRAWAGPAVLGLVVAEGAFRGFGDTRIPLVASLVAAGINLVLDPFLMFTCNMKVVGAAAATAISQVGAFGVYLYFLKKRNMLPQKSDPTTKIRSRNVIMTILGANLSMFTKQASLLLAWAYATAKATRLGHEHVAAHQVGLSFWLVFALWLDGAGVAAQVLASQYATMKNKIRSLTKYMLKIATAQGVLSMLILFALGPFVPSVFTSDLAIRHHVSQLMPHMAIQQVLISLTLVVEALAAGGQQFSLLAWGTLASTVLSVQQIQMSGSVEEIWFRGINLLFCGRLATALLGVVRINTSFGKKRISKDDFNDASREDDDNTL